MRLKLQNAFKIPQRRLRPDEERLLQECASYIRGRGLCAPVSLALEGSRPLHFLGGGVCRMLESVMEAALLKPGSMKKIARLLENPLAVDRLLELLSERGR
ncbi:MAG: hypothetical protein GX410_09015 [Elusimicrobia bacterium]|nr:hypothetical protein [Elusimicrobiota bacterium]